MKIRTFSLLILLSLIIGLAVPTSRVAANHVVLQDKSAPVDCSAIVECDYINLHNRPAEGFITNAMFAPLPITAGFERQPIFGYIEMHTRPSVKVAGIIIAIPLTGAIMPTASDLSSLEGQPIYGYLQMHNRSTIGLTPNAAVSPLPTSPAFVQMPIYGYLQMHNR